MLILIVKKTKKIQLFDMHTAQDASIEYYRVEILVRLHKITPLLAFSKSDDNDHISEQDRKVKQVR